MRLKTVVSPALAKRGIAVKNKTIAASETGT